MASSRRRRGRRDGPEQRGYYRAQGRRGPQILSLPLSSLVFSFFILLFPLFLDPPTLFVG